MAFNVRRKEEKETTSLLIEDANILTMTSVPPKPCTNKRLKLIICLSVFLLIITAIITTLYSFQTWPFDNNSSSSNRVTAADINELRVLLAQAFVDSSDGDQDPLFGDPEPLIATTVRLVFHDCGGIPYESLNPRYNQNAITLCDGCIDLSNLDKHSHLEEFAVEPLESIYTKYQNKMSRADFWVTAGLLALEYASNPSIGIRNQSILEVDPIPNLGFWFGRPDCITSPDADETGGTFPIPEVGWNDTYSWFDYHFGLTVRETVALIGAHTLGRAHLNASGYINPWVVPGSNILNNWFYQFLYDQTVAWHQFEVEGSGVIQWGSMPSRNAMMFNSDMCLWIKIVDHLDLNNRGSVSCAFVVNQTEMEVCPPQEETRGIVLEYIQDQELWLREFAEVFQKMTFAGYDVENDDGFYFVESELAQDLL